MLTHWDSLSVPSGLWVQKAAVGPVSKREVGTTGQSQPGTEQPLKERGLACCQSVLTEISFFPVLEKLSCCEQRQSPVLQPGDTV